MNGSNWLNVCPLFERGVTAFIKTECSMFKFLQIPCWTCIVGAWSLLLGTSDWQVKNLSCCLSLPTLPTTSSSTMGVAWQQWNCHNQAKQSITETSGSQGNTVEKASAKRLRRRPNSEYEREISRRDWTWWWRENKADSFHFTLHH